MRNRLGLESAQDYTASPIHSHVRTTGPVDLIVDRYIVRLVALPTLFGFLLLILLVTAFNAATLLRDAAFSRIPFEHVLTMVFLRDVTASEVLLPTALYFGVLATMLNWHREREAFAFYGAGIGPLRMARPVWLLCFVASVVVATLALFARPWAYGESYRLDASAASLSTSAMQAGRFYSISDDTVLVANAIDRDADTMQGVFMQNRMTGGVRIIHAESGRILPAAADVGRRIELEHGVSQWIDDATLADRQSTFERLVYFAPEEAFEGISSQRRALATAMLLGSERPKEVAELQWRVTLPLTAFFMMLIAVELSRSKPKSSPYPRLIVGLVVYAIVFNMGAVARTWVENGQTAALPGMLWVPLLPLVIFVLLRRIPALSLARPA